MPGTSTVYLIFNQLSILQILIFHSVCHLNCLSRVRWSQKSGNLLKGSLSIYWTFEFSIFWYFLTFIQLAIELFNASNSTTFPEKNRHQIKSCGSDQKRYCTWIKWNQATQQLHASHHRSHHLPTRWKTGYSEYSYNTWGLCNILDELSGTQVNQEDRCIQKGR